MNASAIVVLRCCSGDVAPFAAALAVALRMARPHRHVLVESVDGDVMWRPPAEAPTIAVRLVLVCGERLDASRLQLPDTTRPVHLTAVVVAPDGRDPAQPVQAVALPRVFADVVGVAGAASMLHGLLDGDEREENRDTDEWLAPEDDRHDAPAVEDDGTVPPWPSTPEGASGLEEFRGPVPEQAPHPSIPAPPSERPRTETGDSAVQEFVMPAPSATIIVTPRPATPPPPVSLPPSAPPRPPSPPAARSAPMPTHTPTPTPVPPTPPGAVFGAASDAPLEGPAGASPAAQVAKRLKRIAGAVEGLAASVVNDWILRAPPAEVAGVGESAPGPDVPLVPVAAPASADCAPVALGASAPRTAAPGSEFTARFIAHVPGRERAVAARLADLSPDARVHLNVKRCQWAPGTAVTVTLRAQGLQVEPPSRTFNWQDDEHVEEFDVTVPPDTAPATVVLKFDAAIDGVVVASLRVDLVVTAETAARRARTSATTTAARTAFASYASADRARVLDRIAAVRISAGLDVFVDCLSIHPGDAWRERLASEIRERDVFLLFWSASAALSTEVAWECRTAIDARGVDAVQLHPLEPDVQPPPALAERHADDVLMWARRAVVPRTDA